MYLYMITIYVLLKHMDTMYYHDTISTINDI